MQQPLLLLGKWEQKHFSWEQRILESILLGSSELYKILACVHPDFLVNTVCETVQYFLF